MNGFDKMIDFVLKMLYRKKRINKKAKIMSLSKTFISLCFALTLTPFICVADIQIATVMPKSGAYKTWGDELNEGAKIAVDEINQKGGLNGEKLNLLSIDDPCSETLALSTAQMLALKKEDKPALVIGPYCSDGLENIAKTYQKGKIFHIVPSLINDQNTSPDASGMIKMFGGIEQAASDLFAFYNDRYAGQNVAIVSNDDNKNINNSILKTIKS